MVRKRTQGVLWLILSLVVTLAPIHDARAAPEYSIKAAYMLLFSRYVEWPQAAFATPSAPIVMCIVGDDPFGAVIDETTEGLQSQNRPLQVRRIAGASEAQGCHIAFIAAAENRNQRRWLTELQHRPILTVTEDPDSLRQGAVLWFVVDADRGQPRIRFEASLPAMQRAGLKISAQMLVAARKVHRGDAGV